MKELKIEEAYTNLDLTDKQNKLLSMKEDFYEETDLNKKKAMKPKIIAPLKANLQNIFFKAKDA